MDQDVDRSEPVPGDTRPARELSEDEIARAMIARIARQVDLESGRVPIAEPEPEDAEPPDDETSAETVEPMAVARADQADKRSEEDVSRELVERIARQVDEEARG